MTLKKICCICAFLLQSAFLHADYSYMSSKDVQAFINNMVVNYNFDRKQLNSIFKEAKFEPNIIETMDRPYEKKNWDAYRSLFLTENRLEAGIAFWKDNKATLDEVEVKYGVPANIIVAIIGVETLYGQHQGKYRVIDSLATLAFNYPKRSEFFTKELREYLLLCKEQNVSPLKYYGSYAGAIGKPQFMPSSYRYYAVAYNGTNKADLINENKDVIFSIANYFVKNGWKRDINVAEPAKVFGGKYKKLATNTKIPGYSFADIISSGVIPKVKTSRHDGKAGVIELTTNNGNEYWIAYPNFYVITRYNTSPQYALVVHLLSEQLKENIK
jgi:membrane-bound lytic murein transglycosylase B